MFRALLIILGCFIPLGFFFSFTTWLLITFVLFPLLVFAIYLYFSLPTATYHPSSRSHVSFVSPAERFRGKVLAHRGGQALYGPTWPENSLAAYEWAWYSSLKDKPKQIYTFKHHQHMSESPICDADGLEIDIWLSKDGEIMVNHDPNIYRHFQGYGLIAEMTREELTNVPLTRYTREVAANKRQVLDEKYSNTPPVGLNALIDQEYIQSQRMPTFRQVVELMSLMYNPAKNPNIDQFPKKVLMIEVKEQRRVKELCVKLKALFDEFPFLYEHAFVAAFNPYVIYQTRLVSPHIVTSFLFVHDLSTHLIRNATDHHIPLPVWFVKNPLLQVVIDEVLYFMGTHTVGLKFLGANLSAGQNKSLTEVTVAHYKATPLQTTDGQPVHVVPTTWVVNNRAQKEWLQSLGVTCITDVAFGYTPLNHGCASAASVTPVHAPS